MTHPLILPLFAMFLVSFFILLLMAKLRVQAVRNKEIDFKYFKTFNPKYAPEGEHKAIQCERHNINLYETPILFYVACLSLIVLGNEGLAAQILAWGYVFVRLIHAYVHVGSNKPLVRKKCFICSLFFLLGLWGLALYSAI